MSITNSADCGMHMIRILCIQDISLVEIHQQIVKLYGKGVMNEGIMYEQCRLFSEGKTDVHDES